MSEKRGAKTRKVTVPNSHRGAERSPGRGKKSGSKEEVKVTPPYQVAADPAYRKVIADLHTCEERYGGLLKSISETEDSRLVSAIRTLKSEVRQRRQLEAQLLTAVEGERQRIGRDLHDDLCQQLGATALMTASVAKRIAKKTKNWVENWHKFRS